MHAGEEDACSPDSSAASLMGIKAHGWCATFHSHRNHEPRFTGGFPEPSVSQSASRCWRRDKDDKDGRRRHELLSQSKDSVEQGELLYIQPAGCRRRNTKDGSHSLSQPGPV